MDAHGTGLLGDAGDAFLHIARSHHHQVVQLVDHHHDERQALVHLVAARLAHQLTPVERRVVAGDVAEADLEQQVVAAVHLLAGPAECVGGLLRVGDRGGEQVRQPVVLPHLHLLGVHQDEAHLVRCGAHEQGRDDAVDAAGLAGAGGAGDQQVRRGGQVEEHRPAGDVLADGDVQRLGGGLGLGRRHDVAQADQLAGVVGDLDADGRTAGDRRQDAHVRGGHRVGDVAVEAGDPRHLHTGAELQLVAGDGGADGLAHQPGLHPVGGEGIHQGAPAGLHLGLVDRLVGAAAEVVHRRQGPLAALGTGAELQLGLLAGAGRRRQGGFRGTGLPAGQRGLRRSPVVVGLEVVQLGRGRRQLALPLALAAQRRHVPHGIAQPARQGAGHGADAAGRLVGQRAHRRAGDQHHPTEEQRGEYDDGARVGQEGTQWLAHQRTDPAAGLAQRVEPVGLTAHHVQHGQDGHPGERPADGQAEAVPTAALADQRHPHAHQADRHDELAKPGEPAHQRRDAPAQRPGELEVDGQAQQHPDADEPDAPELVLPALHRLAQLGGRLVAPAHRPGGLCRGATSTPRGCGGKRVVARPAIGLAVGGHGGPHGTKGARAG